MNSDPDPFEQGERAARENIPAEANPYQDGSEQHALWAAGHEKVAGAREANESEGTSPRAGGGSDRCSRAVNRHPEERSQRASKDGPRAPIILRGA